VVADKPKSTERLSEQVIRFSALLSAVGMKLKNNYNREGCC
jgi:hypothetical protein